MSVRTLVKSIQDILRQDTGVDGDAQRISQLCWMFFLKVTDDQDKELEVLKDFYRSPIPARLQWRACSFSGWANSTSQRGNCRGAGHGEAQVSRPDVHPG